MLLYAHCRKKGIMEFEQRNQCGGDSGANQRKACCGLWLERNFGIITSEILRLPGWGDNNKGIVE